MLTRKSLLFWLAVRYAIIIGLLISSWYRILDPALGVALLTATLIVSNVAVRILAGTRFKTLVRSLLYWGSLSVVAALWLLSIVTIEAAFIIVILIIIPVSIYEMFRASFYPSEDTLGP